MLRSRILGKFGWQSSKTDDISPDVVNQGVSVHYENALALAAQGLDAEALKELKQAIEENSNSAEAHHQLGKTYGKLGHLKKAIKAYQTALRIRPDVRTCNDLGAAYDCAGNFLEAIKIYMKALRLKPDSVDVRNNLGMAYYNIGSYSEATKAFNQALWIEDDNVQAHYGLALVHIDLRLKESALEQHKTLIKLGQTEVAAQLLDEIHRQFQ